MTSFGPPYPLPRSMGEFQRLCLRLLRRHWQLPHLERFHDADARDLGIDLLEISGRSGLHAVRCELRAMREAPGAAELKSAVDRAASLGLPIGNFVIATTAWRSKALMEAVFDLNRSQRVAKLFAVEVLCWEDIEELLDEYPDVLAQFESAPKRQALTKADSRCRFEPRSIALPPSESVEEPSVELEEAFSHLEGRAYQMARLRMMQLRERSWSAMNQGQKLALLTNLALAWIGESELRKAAMLFIAARSLGADQENACTNEILGYEMLGDYEHACSLAQNVSARFPSSGRALALWLNNLPASQKVAELQAQVPAELAGDPEVGMVLARRAIAESDYPHAEQFARNAVKSAPGSCDAWLLLGQSILLCEIETLGAAAVEDRVREAEESFGRAVSAAQTQGAVAVEVHALIGRAQARIALHDIEGAGDDIEAAHSLEREDANGLCEYGILLRSRGQLVDAIEIFRRAVRIGGRDDAEYHLAVTLAERATPGDLQEAATLFMFALREQQSIPSGEYLFAVSCTVETLSALERWHEAEELLEELGTERIPPLALWTLRARLELSRGNTNDASQFADTALTELGPEASAAQKRKLAALLHDIGRYAEALILWQSVCYGSGAVPLDSRRLLECANRLGREDVVLEAYRELRSRGDLSEDALGFELEILERHDPEQALTLLEKHVENHPEDRVMRLRRSVLARRLGRQEFVTAEPQSMPPAREVLPSLGRIAVNLMREAGRPNDALSYAYELLRRNPSDADAHRAYRSALGPLGPTPTVPDFETVQPGAAVCFVEPDSGSEQWVILEDGPDVDESASEYGPTHPLARQLRGRRPGDKFQLPDNTSRFSRRTAVVKRIISKYAWRYQDCLDGWESRFPGLPEIEMVQSRQKIIDWDEVASRLETPVVQPASRPDVIEQARREYVSSPLPIHGFAERLGLGDLLGVFQLASMPEVQIKCCEGSEDELNAALAALDRAETVVLDLSAIATLCLLGRLSILQSWPRHFMIASATLHALRRLQFDDVGVRLPAGFSASLESDGDGSAGRPEVEIKALADSIQNACAIGENRMLAALAPEQRDRLIGLFGRSGAESIVLASMPGRVLWTDDGMLASYARTEFGVRRIWTQSALMTRVRAGSLDPAELATAGTKLAGWGYAFTTPSLETLMRAGSVAMWNPANFPLGQALDMFATDSLKLGDAVTLAAEFIVKMYADVYLRSMRTTVTMRLLDRLSERDGGREAIQALPQSLPIRFGLDLIRARELADAIRGWMAERPEEIAA